MARTAPVPNIPPIPGMCPSIAVMGGGAGGGGGSGDGAGDGDGNGAADGSGNGSDASGDGRQGGCAAGDPVCPITGRIVLELYDFGFGGMLPLRWLRRYSSRTSDLAGELGHGWSHSFGWRLRVRRDRVQVIDDWARIQEFAIKPGVDSAENAIGMRLERTPGGFVLVHNLEQRRLTFGAEAADGYHHLREVTDPCGNSIAIHRDDRGYLRGLVDSAGRNYRVSVDDRGRILEVHVALGDLDAATGNVPGWLRTITYTYDEDGDLVAAVDAENYRWGYIYQRHLMVEHQAASGLSIFYRFDGAGKDARCIESWGEYRNGPDPALLEQPPPAPPPGMPDNRKLKGIMHVRLTYDVGTRYTEVQTSLGGVTRYFGDSVGRATKIIYPDGSVENRTFDPASGGLVGVVDRGGGQRRGATDPGGTPESWDDSFGDGVQRRFLPNRTVADTNRATGGVITRQTDERGLVIFIKHPDGTTEEFSHDPRGALTRSIDRMGVVTRYTHDRGGNCIAVERPGAVERNEYDYLGRRIAHIDAEGDRTDWRYDMRSEVVWKRLPDGAGEIFIERNADRKPVMVRDVDRTTRFAWGGVKWLCQRTEADGSVTEYRYSPEGHLIWVKNARGQIFEQEVDFARRYVRAKTFEGYELQAGFSGPNQTSLRSAAGRMTLEHDAAGRLLKLETPTGAIELEHGAAGLTKLDYGNIKLAMEYDATGRIVRDKQARHENRVSWHGGKIAHIVSSKGAPVSYEYDQLGRLYALQVGSKRVIVAFGTDDDLITYFGDDVVLRETFTAAGSMKTQAVTRYNAAVPIEACGRQGDPQLRFSRRFQHDVTQRYPVSEWRSDGTSVEWELDVMKRITAQRTTRANQVIAEERLRYDAAGTVRVDQASYDSEVRPVGLNGETFEYDSSGRLVKRVTDRGVFRYEWNALDQLVRVTTPDRVVAMSYDGDGRRMRKCVYRKKELVGETSYIWAGHTLLHEVNELDGSTRTYVRAPDSWQPIGHLDISAGQERLVAYVQDSSGRVEMALDEDAQVVWSATYSVFGAATVKTAAVDVTVRFANQFWDADVELTYNRHRWYDARLGLYITPDPFLLAGTYNPRDYASNPLVDYDPMGLAPHPGVGSGKGGNKHHPSPPGNPSGTKRPGNVDAMDAEYMSGEGHWARPDMAPPARRGHIPGYADCPNDALDEGSGFGKAQGIVDKAGKAYGCHGCGARKSGWPDNADGTQHWTCDHQPPRTTYSKSTVKKTGDSSSRTESRTAGSVRLYPHCMNCSRRQGGIMGGMDHDRRVERGQEVMDDH